MSQPTTGVYFNQTTPAPPPGNQNITFQSDGAVPQQSITACPQIATDALVGVVKPDGVTLQVDETGEMSVINPGTSGGGGTGGETVTGAAPVVVVPQGARDGSNTQFTIPAPVLAGSNGTLYRNGVAQRQLGTSAEFAVQGTQITTLYPPLSTDWLEFYYVQGTPNSESGGGGSVNPVGPPSGLTMAAFTGTSVTIPWPSGAVAGDLIIIPMGVAGGLSTAPSGWTVTQEQTGSFVSGWVLSKILTSADISAGSVTVTFSTTTVGVYSIVDVVGGGAIREAEASQTGPFVNPVTLTTSSAVQGSDFSIYFGANGSNSFAGASAASINQGTLQSSYTISPGAAAVGGALYTASPSPAGATSVVFDYSGGTGVGPATYQAVIVVIP